LPGPAKTFQTVDKSWKAIMKATNDDPNALKAGTTDKNRRDLFKQHNANLDQIQKDLEVYIRIFYISKFIYIYKYMYIYTHLFIYIHIYIKNSINIYVYIGLFGDQENVISIILFHTAISIFLIVIYI
jgi:hypothetical protein